MIISSPPGASQQTETALASSERLLFSSYPALPLSQASDKFFFYKSESGVFSARLDRISLDLDFYVTSPDGIPKSPTHWEMACSETKRKL